MGRVIHTIPDRCCQVGLYLFTRICLAFFSCVYYYHFVLFRELKIGVFIGIFALVLLYHMLYKYIYMYIYFFWFV